MQYRLKKLASGAYDVLLAGEVVASLVKVPYSRSAYWVVELLDAAARPAPEHTFPSLDDAKAFLGIGPDATPGATSAGFPGIEVGEAT